nr:ORF2 [Torque teno felis virus]
MEPVPGPALMLPALDLSGSPDLDHNQSYKRREAQFKRDVSLLHKQWCLCGSYLNHFRLSSEPLKTCSEDTDAATGGSDADGGEAATTCVMDTGDAVAGGEDGYGEGDAL